MARAYTGLEPERLKWEVDRTVKRILMLASALACTMGLASAALVVKNLQVEYRTNPLGIDVAQPRFGWQMAATAGERGAGQAAYQLEVKGWLLSEIGRAHV